MSDDPTALAAFVPPSPATPVASQTPSPGVRKVAPNVELTDFNDEAVKQYEFEYYQPKQGETSRIFLLGVRSLAKARSHFHDKLRGGGALCMSTYTRSADGRSETLVEAKKCCEWLGQPQTRFAILVIQYATDRMGAILRPFRMDLKLWRFGVDKYKQLQAINTDFPLDKHDLSVLCTEEKYQRLQIGAKPESVFLHPNFPADERARVEQWAAASVSKLPSQMGRTFASEQELYKALVEAQILNPSGPAPTMVHPGDAPVADFADIIGTAVPMPGQ